MAKATRIALALQGIATICYDPIGQGERSQILTAEGKPEFVSTTQEHFLMGVGAILVGLVAMMAISTDLYLPSLPSIARDFGVDVAAAQLTLSAFMLGIAAG